MANWETVRRILVGFPETVEGTSYRTAAFRIRKQFFVRLREDDDTLVIKAGQQLRAALLTEGDPPFYTTTHYDGPESGHVLVRLGTIGDDELRDVLTDAWLVNAPERLASQWRSGSVQDAKDN